MSLPNFDPTRSAARFADSDLPGPTGLAVIWAMVSLALIVVTARVFVQARLTKQFGLSDGLMICSVAILSGFAALISVQYHYGWGRHQACIKNPEEVEMQLKFNITGQSFGIMGSTFGRLSFIVFMLHLFDTKTWPRWTLRVFFVMQIITNVGTAVACYAQCSDPRALYDSSLPESLCWPADVQTVRKAPFYLRTFVPGTLVRSCPALT